MNEDRRDLGVAVSEPRFLKKMPKDGVGFYGWEIWGGEEIPGWPEGKEQRFRWTGKRASVPMRMAQSAEREAERAERIEKGKGRGRKTEDRGRRAPRLNTLKGNPVQLGREDRGEGKERDLGIEVFLRCKHPDVGDEAVVVRISDERGLLRTVIFEKREWRKVVLGGDELKDSEVVTFEVSRTWNPKRMGVSGDNRDLGIAVATHTDRHRHPGINSRKKAQKAQR